MDGHGLTFPELQEPYAGALRDCVHQMSARYDLVAILASGTVVRGVGDLRSDLDVHVLHRGPFRERLQRWFKGVPCEIFVNPPWRIGQYFSEDAEDRRPMTAHMFATGVIVYDPEGLAKALQEEAKSRLRETSLPDSAALTEQRYHASTLLEDAFDLAERDSAGAALLLGLAVHRLAECRIASEPGWLPRGKDLLLSLRSVDHECAELVVTACGSSSLEDRLQAARELSIRVAGAEGFFEWESARETLTRPADAP